MRVLHRYKRRWKIEYLFAWLNRFKKAITRWEHCAEQYYHPCLSCFFYDFALPYYNKWIPIMKWVLIKYPIMESSSEKNWEKVYILVYYKNKTTIYSDRAFPWSPKEQSIKGLSHRVRQRKTEEKVCIFGILWRWKTASHDMAFCKRTCHRKRLMRDFLKFQRNGQ